MTLFNNRKRIYERRFVPFEVSGPAGKGIAQGGTAGQFLVKNSNVDYDTGWSNAMSGTVTSVSSANSDISVSSPTTAPTLTLNSGVGANKIVKLDSLGRLPAVDGSQLTGLLGTGTVTSISVVSANGLAGTVATATTTPAITLSTTVTGVLQGNGTAISAASVSSTPAVSSLVQTDANGNAGITNVNLGYSTTVTNGGTTTLTVSSNNQQYFTGSQNQTVVMPVTSTLTLGQEWLLDNNSSQSIEIQSSGGNTIFTLAGGTSAYITCTTISGTGSSSWDFDYLGVGIASGKKLSVSNSLTLAGTDGTTQTFPAYSSNIADYSYATFATAGGTTTLTNTSKNVIQFTGSSNQTCVLPDATTIPLGRSYIIDNDSSGIITVNANGGANIITLPANTVATVVSYSNGSAGGSWDNSQYIGEIFVNGKYLGVNNSLTLAGTDGTTMTFPSTSATIARTDAANTFTGTQTFSNAVINTNNAITASGNAATVPITARLNTVTNNSAATLTITMATASAVDGQLTMVRILDATAAAQTITWVNTEDSTVTAPTTSNGSTTLPLTVGFQYNSATSKWRTMAKA